MHSDEIRSFPGSVEWRVQRLFALYGPAALNDATTDAAPPAEALPSPLNYQPTREARRERQRDAARALMPLVEAFTPAVAAAVAWLLVRLLPRAELVALFVGLGGIVVVFYIAIILSHSPTKASR